MRTRFISLAMAMTASGAASLLAQATAAQMGEGTLTLATKKYSLKHAVAYETTIDNEPAVSVVLSAQAVASEKLTEAREAERDGGDPDFKRPFLRLVFKKSGELKHWSAAAGGTSLGRHSGKASGELKLQDGRVTGRASQPLESEGMFPTGFDARFDVALLKQGEALPASTARKGGPAADVKPFVTGVFKGNGKEANLAFVSARWGEPFSGKAGIALVFTEKDHSKEKKPDVGAMFGKFGSALIISLHEDGQIYGCQVVHSAHQKQGFSSIGKLEANDFVYEDGKVAGELTTSGPADTFGETWEVNIKFVAPLGEIPKELQPAESKKPAKSEKPTAVEADEDADESPSQPASAGLKAKDLAITKDASGVEYKALVEQIVFQSKSDVKAVCAELAANLKAQGWAIDGRDMVQPQSSILKRKRGDAKLTIFVKPAAGGSEVKMMTEGLSWE
ncbi:MAG TPA: hypothetical protein VF551_10115 [Chthoniobacterales bacterium]